VERRGILTDATMFRGNNHRLSPMMARFQAYHLPILVAMIVIRLYFVKNLHQWRAINFSRVENDLVNSSALLHVETNQSTSCRRPCEKRMNKIIFTTHNAAGLSDRHFVLTLLADLAGYLCAVVEFPPPTKMLHPKHNDNIKSDAKIVWTDYWNITFIDNAQPSIRTLPVIDGNRGSTSKYSKLGDEDYKDWYYVLTRTIEEVYHDFEKIERASWEFPNPGFVWEIRVHWYKETRNVMWDGLKARDQSYPEWTMLPPVQKYPLRPDCTYIKEEVPNRVQRVVDDVKVLIKNQSPPNATIGYFHVRRGDGISSCDTSLARMQSYLQCTFQGLKRDRGGITLLFLTVDP
jgi:hypothetical protein